MRAVLVFFTAVSLPAYLATFMFSSVVLCIRVHKYIALEIVLRTEHLINLKGVMDDMYARYCKP